MAKQKKFDVMKNLNFSQLEKSNNGDILDTNKTIEEQESSESEEPFAIQESPKYLDLNILKTKRLKPKKVRRVILLTEEMNDSLIRMAESYGVSVNALVNEILQQVIVDD